MSVSQAAPSPFAALLRRSRFASYDPTIGQVYTTHGGHSHRGNWGLKRPLPNRRRTGFITVRSVDSPEQQTEWNSAEGSARWMRRWEELGKKLEVVELGHWDEKGRVPWTCDSEFDRAGKVGLEPGRERQRESATPDTRDIAPNVDAMTPRQYQKYLEQLRTLRPEFQKFLKETVEKLDCLDQAKAKQQPSNPPKLRSEYRTIKTAGSGQVDMYASAQGASDIYVHKFLRQRAELNLNSLKSNRIQPRPHPRAGLEYTYMSALQSQYLHRPAPGRDIAQSRATRYENAKLAEKVDLVAVGGIVGVLGGTHSLMPTDFGTRELPRRDRLQGKGVFRMSKVELFNAPSTVGRLPETARHAALRRVEFRTLEAANANRSNPHPLGSMEYVSCEGITRGKQALFIPGPVRASAKAAREQQRPKSQSGKEAKVLLSTLVAMIQK